LQFIRILRYAGSNNKDIEEEIDLKLSYGNSEEYDMVTANLI
jgi:hypothetical protein